MDTGTPKIKKKNVWAWAALTFLNTEILSHIEELCIWDMIAVFLDQVVGYLRSRIFYSGY